MTYVMDSEELTRSAPIFEGVFRKLSSWQDKSQFAPRGGPAQVGAVAPDTRHIHVALDRAVEFPSLWLDDRSC